MTASDTDAGRFELEVTDVRKSFGGVEVLHGVTFRAVGGRVIALLGENGAGKSTLVRVVAGAHRPDGGALRINDESFSSLDPRSARRAGIRMIYQEFTDAGSLTVAENISLGRWPMRRGLVSWPAMRRRAREILARLGSEIDPDALVGNLTVGNRQLCEIARALADEARCLILDEPTAALSSGEVETLFSYLKALRAQGVAIIYITHRLDEVAAVADDVVVLRDGLVALSGTADLPRRELVSAMVGRDLGAVARPAATEALGSDVRLKMSHGSSKAFEDVSFEVRSGEVVGLYGKVGSGTSEVADVVFGRRRLTAGELAVDGRAVTFASPAAAIRHGVGFLPSDRQREGAFMVRSVAENLAAPSWRQMASRGVLSTRVESRAFERWKTTMKITTLGDARLAISKLSGGNQQKVILARWLERGSGVLVLVEPTRGVDVAARQDIYTAVRAMARTDGIAVLIVTSDYEEVVQAADRAVVMVQGRISARLEGDEISTRRLTEAVSAMAQNSEVER